MSDEDRIIVIDHGSGSYRIGFAGDEEPKEIFPNVVGRPKFYKTFLSEKKDYYIGNDACSKASILELKYPIERGIVTNFDDLEKIWKYSFDLLKIDPSEYSVIVTETNDYSYESIANRKKIMQLLFDYYHIKSFYIGDKGLFSLYGSGYTTGTVLQSGEGVTSIVPIYERHSIQHAKRVLKIGGRDVNEYLEKLFKKQNIDFSNSSEKEIIRNIKENVGYLAGSYNEERLKCAELMFDPSLNYLNFEGIDKCLNDSIMMCDQDARKDLYKAIILAGGNTFFDGFDIRIEKEISNMVPLTTKVHVRRPPYKNLAWIGGSIMGSLATFDQMAITKEEYDNSGSDFVQRKCF